MTTKISDLVEGIFANAVALDQNGGLKNTIYAIGSEVFIMNYDHTVLLRFRLRKSEAAFDSPISFKANDYDSNEFEQKDGRVIFYSGNDGYKKKKTCGTTDLTPEEVKELFEGYMEDAEETLTTVLSKNVLELMDDSLSHIEFTGATGEGVKLTQRNIYSGGVIEVEKNSDGFFKDELDGDFGPIGIKTSDFQALFTFQNQLRFSFPTSMETNNFIVVKSVESKRDMTGIIASCLYDEIIQIKEVKRTEQKKSKPMLKRK